jgi:hypothetical protein
MHFPVLGTGYSQHLQSSTETDSAFLSPEPEYPCPTDVMGAGNCGKGLFSRGRIAQYALTDLCFTPLTSTLGQTDLCH